MISFSLNGKLSPDAVEAIGRLSHDELDTSEDGTYLFVKDDHVSVYAVVANQRVREYFCTDKDGNRVPSFALRRQVDKEYVCWVCWLDSTGQKFTCHSTLCENPW